MKVRLLGPVSAEINGTEVGLGGRHQRAVFALLALSAGRVVPLDRLVDELWRDEPPSRATLSLQSYVSRLRRLLGDGARIVTRPPGWLLDLDPAEVDVTRFGSLVDQARHGAPAEAVPVLRHALGLWRGEALADLQDLAFARQEATRLADLRLSATGMLLDAMLAGGEADAAIAEARRVVAEHPYHEQAWQALMLALYRTGRQSEAVAAAADLRRVLADELGLDPAPETRRLEQRILRQDPGLTLPTAPASGDAGRPPASATAKSPAVEPTSLVGRLKELADLEDLLARSRLLTLTGPGGAGKTRLARELMGRQQDRDTWFVDLSVLDDDGLVAPTVARAVGAPLTPHGDPVDAVVDRLGRARGLLVLDNCEHLVDAAGALVSRLLRGCPHLVQVTTSRRPLRVAGEVTWPVPPLELPPSGAVAAAAVAETPAAELFADRAAAVRPGFAIDDRNAADVAVIVRALDGQPLAIELAAAHADVLPVDAIRRRLADRFELLETDVRDVPARQRTLRAVIDSSVDLLTPAERRFFVRLGVFAGSFDLEAAAAVTGNPAADSYRLTASLVRQSLVVPTAGGRYRMLESLRMYAAQALGADPVMPELQQRHLAHLVDLMTTADHHIRTNAQEEWLIRVRESLQDLRAALRWSLAGAAPEQGVLLAARSAWYWTLEGMLAEARQWLDAAEAAPVTQDGIRAALCLAVGRIAAPLGELARAREACAASVRISRRTGDHRLLGEALVTVGIIDWALGDLAAAAAAHDEAVHRLTAVGERWNRVAALVLRARTAVDAGDADVDDRIETALVSARQSGERHLIGLAVSQQGRRALLAGDAGAALRAAEQSLTVWREVGYQEGEINALNLMGRALTAQSRPAEAEELLLRSLRTARTIRHRGGLYEGLECLAAVLHATGRDEQARRALTVVERERRSSGIPTPAAEAGALADLAARIRDRVGDAGRRPPGAANRTVDTLLDELGVTG